MCKKIAAVLCLVVLFSLVCGCEIENDSKIKESSESSLLENVQIDLKDQYYKLQVVEMDVDTENLVKYLLGEDATYYKNAIKEVNPELPNDEYYILDTNDFYYTWETNTINGNLFFLKGDGTFSGFPEDDSGQRLAYDFAKKINENIGLDCKKNYPAELIENATKYSFFEEYKGVSFMGNTHIALGSGLSIDGITIDVTVDCEGIKQVTLSNLLTVTDEIEAFNQSDFMSVDEVAYLADEYGKKMLEISQIDSSYELCNISIIYIPMEEKGEIYWIPGYEVISECDNEGVIEQYCTLIDAFNGYVYQWFSI